MSDLVLLEKVENSGGVAVVTFNRPDNNNGWTSSLEMAYFARLEECENDPEVKVIVVTGAGRSFCPGADMGALSAGASGSGGSGAIGGSGGVPKPSQPLWFPAVMTKPIIGAINGACAGVGLVQALMFDLRFAAAGAKFTMAFARRGLIAEYGCAWTLPRIVGQANALDLLMSSRVVLAEEALQMGLVNRVVPKEELLAHTIAYATDVAINCSPTSMAVMKAQVRRAWEMELPDAVNEAYGLMNKSLQKPDFKEGVMSFIQKREPSFGPLQQDLLP